jgi:hypothetical protein
MCSVHDIVADDPFSAQNRTELQELLRVAPLDAMEVASSYHVEADGKAFLDIGKRLGLAFTGGRCDSNTDFMVVCVTPNACLCSLFRLNRT